IKAVALLALAHDDRAGRDLLALHLLAEAHERLARQPREQTYALQLVLGCATSRHRDRHRREDPAAPPTDSASTPPRSGGPSAPAPARARSARDCRASPDLHSG